jgi:hypothetical protein
MIFSRAAAAHNNSHLIGGLATNHQPLKTAQKKTMTTGIQSEMVTPHPFCRVDDGWPII